MDLHPQSGQLALREAGVFEAFQEHALPAVEEMKLTKSDGSICWDQNDMKTMESRHLRERPEIDRTALRGILLDFIKLGCVQWNKKFLYITQSSTIKDKCDIQFSHGVDRDFDLVVGADGGWSKVRPLLTNQRPFSSGLTMIELRAKEVSSKKQ